MLDRAIGKLTFMASQAGGMEIEEVAHARPRKLIYKEPIEPASSASQPWQARNLAFKLGLKRCPDQRQAVGFMTGTLQGFR